MGVPKFFRWISERYPKIIQRHGTPPVEETCREHFNGKAPPDYLPPPDLMSTTGLAPLVDRLYLDMNGIIHGCSHNNANPEEEGSCNVSEEAIFRNVCYYLDRIVKDIAKPRELVYLAIDGVAPRAKLNQQRSRRYRSGKEGEIERTVYDAHLKAIERDIAAKGKVSDEVQLDDYLDHGITDYDSNTPRSMSTESIGEGGLTEVQPGRFTGKFETLESDTSDRLPSSSSAADPDAEDYFHSNAITPGTSFFSRCTAHIEHFVRRKISEDEAWKNLTVVFSGPNTPGEGEHKIMQFIREQRVQPNYDPNLRHCILGQDGDLIMLGLATHEPNLVLLREQVLFGPRSWTADELAAKYGLDMYIHNPNFEFLHMSVLRDYLAFEFETSNVIPESKFDLERTIDDFVFLTFLVGNDFLPHMPALDIADEAFEFIFHTYRGIRSDWIKEHKKDPSKQPYLTDTGDIVCGQRLEQFLGRLGSHETSFFLYKKANENPAAARKVEAKWGVETTPSDEVLSRKEEADRASFREMLLSSSASNSTWQEDGFTPVLTEVSDLTDEDLHSKMSTLLQASVADRTGGKRAPGIDDQDIKGRYYHDKFGFTPFDREKHLALRKAYVEGLVWNLKYYYEGCVSWDWYFPFHYGPMLSDLVDLENLLGEVSFEGRMGKPLKPFEQLMACMPPSHSELLPEPYRPLMTEPDSTISEFYPRSFTVDMNGKRWPWEAVVLLPFIDSSRLLEAAHSVDQSKLSSDEILRNQLTDATVFVHEGTRSDYLPKLADGKIFDEVTECKTSSTPFGSTHWYTGDKRTVLKPEILDGTEVPLCGVPTLRDGLVKGVWRRQLRVNVHGVKSRYQTSCLELENFMPYVVELPVLASQLIGTIVYINYPHYIEAFVTAVSNGRCSIRGEGPLRVLPKYDVVARENRLKRIVKSYVTGEGQVGTGGICLVDEQAMLESDVLLHVRPLSGLKKLGAGSFAKSYSTFEVEVPLFVTTWGPAKCDPRLAGIPTLLEKDPFTAAKSVLPETQPSGSTPTARAVPPKLLHSYSALLGRVSNRGFHTGAQGRLGWQRDHARLFSTNCADLSPVKPIRLIEQYHVNCTPSTRRIAATPVKTRFVTAVAIATVAFLFPHVTQGSWDSAKSRFSTRVFGSETTAKDKSKSVFHIDERSSKVPPLQFAHGTTTLSFVFDGGIIAAVDSRASMGTFISSKTTQKMLPINSHVIGTMAGGAADCSHWIRCLSTESEFYDLCRRRPLSVTSASRILSNVLFEYRGCGLSVGTMIMGFDHISTLENNDKVDSQPKIFYIDDLGTRIQGDMFSVGSGSSFALGVISSERKMSMTEEEAIELGIKAIRHATFRDAFSGGFINVFLLTPKGGWKRVFSEDVAAGAIVG